MCSDNPVTSAWAGGAIPNSTPAAMAAPHHTVVVPHHVMVGARSMFVVSAFVRPGSGESATAKVSILDVTGTEIATKRVGVTHSNPPKDWTRIIFKFVPTSPTIHVVLSDEYTTEGSTLYWDFVELEDAYPVE